MKRGPAAARKAARLALLRRSAAALAACGFDLSDLLYRLSSKNRAETFSAAGAAGLWRGFLGDGGRGGRLRVYAKVPFCSSRCAFCHFFTLVRPAPAAADAYLRALAAEAAYFGRAFKGTRPAQLYVGGTPSYLDGRRLGRLFGALFSAFDFEPGGPKVLEVSPGTMTAAKLRLAAGAGFNRLSIGVQTLTPAVLSAMNRPQEGRAALDLVRRAQAEFRHGAAVDLLLGLRGDGARGLLNSFSKVAACGPDTISVYDLCLSPGYVRRFYAGDAGAALREIAAVRAEAQEPLKQEGARRGYAFISRCEGREWLFLKRRPGREAGRDMLRDPLAVLGLGPGTRSRVFGGGSYTQQEGTFPSFSPRAALFTGRRGTEREDMLKFVFNALRNGEEMNDPVFRARFGRPLAEAFGPELAELEALGLSPAAGLKPRGPLDLLLCGLVFAGLERFLKEALPAFPPEVAAALRAARG